MIETIYDFILFETRIGSTIGWAFREPEKLAYLIAFAYSLGFFYSFTAQTKKSLTTRILNILSLAFGSIILILYFTYLLQVTSINLKKVKETPNDYNVVNKYLKSDNEVFNIAVFPQVQRTNWIKTIDSGNYFSNLSIEKPVIPLSEADSRSKFFLNETFTKKSTIPNDISKNINLIGAKYLVLRKDYLGYSSSQFKSALSENTNLEKVLDLDTVSLYKNSQYKSIVTSTNKNIITNYGFKVFDIINNQSDRNIVNTNIIFTDLDNYYDMDISDKNTDFIMDNDGVTDLSILLSKNKKTLYPADELSNVNPSLGWAKLNINNKTHAEAQLYFDNAELNQYQFNNEHEVSFVMIDRVVNNIDEALKSKKYYFNFELHDRYEIQIENNNHNIYFSGENSITQDSWNILTSSKFEIRENNPFYIYAKFTGANDLEPHIKTDFFNGLGERITTRVIYPNEGIFNSAFGIPYGTAYAKISIWTRNITNDNSWNITNLNAYEGNFAISYPANVIKLAQHNCDKCAVYARVFKSGSGGKIGFEIQNKTFEIFTRSIFNKYTWAKIANFDNFNEDEIKIINYDGINSVASIAILDEEELNQNSKKINSILSSTEEKTNYENDVVYYKSDGNTNTENTNITVNKINPTLYEVEMKLDKNDKQTILFLKPFSLGWVTSEGEKSQIGNGFVNKFKISPNKKVQIYHYPQRMFEMGLKISAVASALILLYLLFTSIRNFKKKDKLVG